jgi:predicted dehydrogenase
MDKSGPTRRNFIPGAAAVFTILPRHVLGGPGYTPPSDKLNIGAIGVGGMGKSYIAGCSSENIAAIAEVDDMLAAPVRAQYPSATSYRDFRTMLEKERGIDAVIIGTPDHSHAVIAMAAIQLGKGVYCAKPMTRTVHEARTVAKAARRANVATQMSVQSCASDEACSTEEWIQAGVVGQVREVHVWTDRPVWPQGLPRPVGNFAVPGSLDWDLWLGPAPARPYNPLYHPFNFRGWYDFGSGALGDMGCHTFHVIVRALDLDSPVSVSADRTFQRVFSPEQKPDPSWTRSVVASTPETFPASSIVTWNFAARGTKPPVRMFWYEGGLRPPRPANMAPEEQLGPDGILFIGEKGILASGFTGGPRLLGERSHKDFTPPSKSLPRTIGHYLEWIEACKGGKPASCNFDFGSQLTEICQLGVSAQRSAKYLAYDASAMRFTNDADANQYLTEQYRSGWSL